MDNTDRSKADFHTCLLCLILGELTEGILGIVFVVIGLCFGVLSFIRVRR